jgi:hypothetical protein
MLPHTAMFHDFLDANGQRQRLLPFFLPWLVTVVCGLATWRLLCDLIPSRTLSFAFFVAGTVCWIYLALAHVVALTTNRVFRGYGARS